MTAAEFKLPDVPNKFSWLSLAQGVFNTQVKRWDTTTCGGGLRWQIWPMQAGYTMKNTISNAGLFQLSARLARWTNDDNYAQWAQKVWDWCMSKGLLNNETWFVADSTSIGDGCSTLGRDQWSYNYAALFTGAAYMYAYVRAPAVFLFFFFSFFYITNTATATDKRFRQSAMVDCRSWSIEPYIRDFLPVSVRRQRHGRGRLRTCRVVQQE